MSARRYFCKASLLCICLALGVAGAAEPASSAAPSASGPWIGVWKLNVARSNYQAGKPAADAIRIYEMRQVAPDAFDVIIDFKDPKNPDGPSVMHMETRGAKFDGRDYRETGNPIADANRFQLVGERSYEFVESRNGKEVIRISVEISEDGNTRISRQNSVGQDGKPVQNVAVWDRVG